MEAYSERAAALAPPTSGAKTFVLVCVKAVNQNDRKLQCRQLTLAAFTVWLSHFSDLVKLRAIRFCVCEVLLPTGSSAIAMVMSAGRESAKFAYWLGVTWQYRRQGNDPCPCAGKTYLAHTPKAPTNDELLGIASNVC